MSTILVSATAEKALFSIAFISEKKFIIYQMSINGSSRKICQLFRPTCVGVVFSTQQQQPIWIPQESDLGKLIDLN